LDWGNLRGQVYECTECGKLVRGEDLLELDQIKCPHCKNRVLKKLRPPIVRRVKAV